ncbi:DUF3857 domain-containing protein [Neolewinella maritima]|nr:DUF3857 domain-containing protein [Neolewinella maritima]
MLILYAGSLSAQYEDGLKFGKIDDADRSLMVAPGDSSAEAYVLYDKLDLRFDFVPDKGPQTLETYHRRVKLIKPSSFERANVTLSYDSDYETIGNLDAEVHLPDGSTIQLRNRDFITDKGADDKSRISFTFPQITPGAIIEYSYTRRSESILIPASYTFQEDIPVRWSEYTARIPEYYRYASLGTQGNYFIQQVEQTHRNWNMTLARGQGNTSSIRFTDMRYVLKDLPPFQYQPYTNNLTDYLPRVKLQLQSVEYPNTMTQPVFNNWETTVRTLHERQDFGRYYQGKAHYNRVWKQAEAQIMAGTTPQERIAAAYYFVASNLQWNEQYNILGSDSPNNVLAAGSGNSADLNLCLLALLNEAGIKAHPLLVSLRDRGAHMEYYPLINQFNHLMVYAEVDDKMILLDVNGSDRPPGLPRIEALNHRGWVADERNPHWISVEVPRARRVVLADMQIAEDGHTAVDLTARLESYYAFAGRNQLHAMEQATEAPVAREVIARFPAASIRSNAVLSGGDNSLEPLTYKVELDLPVAVATQDFLYIQPILIPALDDALDDVDARLYPVDFPFPWREQFITTVHVPAGYVLDEVPESIRMVSEDGGMTATFTTTVQPDHTVIINFSVDMDRTFYQATDYPTLRGMYRRIIDLQETTLVYKRAK